MTYGSFSDYQVVPAKLVMPVPLAAKEVVALLTSGLTASIGKPLAVSVHAGNVFSYAPVTVPVPHCTIVQVQVVQHAQPLPRQEYLATHRVLYARLALFCILCLFRGFAAVPHHPSPTCHAQQVCPASSFQLPVCGVSSAVIWRQQVVPVVCHQTPVLALLLAEAAVFVSSTPKPCHDNVQLVCRS